MLQIVLLSLVRGLGEVRGSLETVRLPVRKRNHILRKSVCACLWNQEISLIRLLEMSNWCVRGATVSWAERRTPSCRISCGHSQGAKAHSADRLSQLHLAEHYESTLENELRSRLSGAERRAIHFPASSLCFCEEMTSKQAFSEPPMSSQHAERRCIFKLSILIGVPPVMSCFHLPMCPKKHSVSLIFRLLINERRLNVMHPDLTASEDFSTHRR